VSGLTVGAPFFHVPLTPRRRLAPNSALRVESSRVPTSPGEQVESRPLAAEQVRLSADWVDSSQSVTPGALSRASFRHRTAMTRRSISCDQVRRAGYQTSRPCCHRRPSCGGRDRGNRAGRDGCWSLIRCGPPCAERGPGGSGRAVRCGLPFAEQGPRGSGRAVRCGLPCAE